MLAPEPGYRYAPESPSEPAPRIRAFEAIQFPFQTPAWLSNLLIGFVFFVIPIAGPIALRGYSAEIHQRLVRRHPEPLPRLSFADLGHFLERGILAFVLELVLFLPLFFAIYLVVGIGVALLVVGAEAGVNTGVLVGAGIGLGLFTIAGMFFSALLYQAGATRVEITEDLGGSLRPAQLWDFMKRAGKPLAWAMVAFAFLATGLFFGGMLFFVVGMYPAVVAIQLASTHLRFQAYRVYLAEGGVPYPLKAPRMLPSEAQRYGHAAHAFGPPPGMTPHAPPPGALPPPPIGWNPGPPPGGAWPPAPPGPPYGPR